METQTFRLIAYEYEGIEISRLLAAKANGTLDLAPKWIRDAVFEGKVTFPDTAPCIQINPKNVPRLGAARDYLLRGPASQLHIVPPETLRDFYEQVEAIIEAQIEPDRCPICTSTGGLHSDQCPNG
jgi:hypothetical protein